MKNTDYLKFPLSKFWIKDSNEDKSLLLGTLEDVKRTSVLSCGNGTVSRVCEDTLEATYEDDKFTYIVTMSPVRKIREGKFTQGQKIANLVKDAISVTVDIETEDGRKRLNPLNNLFLGEEQETYRNIPYHSPRNKPTVPFFLRKVGPNHE